jgi:hypothetical protein
MLAGEDRYVEPFPSQNGWFSRADGWLGLRADWRLVNWLAASCT